MIVYKIPPTKQGILCALFESFTQKEVPNVVTSSDFQPTFDCVVKDIKIDFEIADRVEKGLIKSGGISLLSTLFYALRSNDGLKETTIFSVAHKCLVARKNLVTNYKDPDMIKGAIILAVLIVLSIGWVAVSKYLSRQVHFETPTALKVSKVENNRVTLSWNAVMYAKEYSIYYEVEGETSSTYYTEKLEFTFTLEENKVYTFYVYVGENDLFGKSETTSISYTLNDGNV